MSLGLTLPDIFMLLIAIVGGAAALLVVSSRNVVHAALYLVIALLGVAATFLMLGAEFLAWSQVLVYVGAVVVLILFGLMLTRAPIGPMAQHNSNGLLALGVSAALFVFLTTMIFRAFGTVRLSLSYTSTGAIGEVLYVYWAFPFMVLGFLLTVALIGAIIVARREEGEGPLPSDAIDSHEPGHLVQAADVTAEPGPATTVPGGPAAPADQVRS